MGQVTFNGNVATAESQVYIRREEQRIMSQPGKTQYQMAREIEILYRTNGLELYSPIRAGSHDVMNEDDMKPRRGIIATGLGWLAGFILIVIATILMKVFGLA